VCRAETCDRSRHVYRRYRYGNSLRAFFFFRKDGSKQKDFKSEWAEFSI